MIILTDAFGILIILTLAYQGYKDSTKPKVSYLLPCLLSFLLFYNTFDALYPLATRILLNKFFAGLLLILCFNVVVIFIFRLIVVVVFAKVTGLLPQASPLVKKLFSILIGILTGYIFVTGSISALHKHVNNDILSHSVFYKISHQQSMKVATPPKIDNLPALNVLYSEENVVMFKFTEQELIGILKMIRAISNQDAQQLLNKLNDNNPDIKSAYNTLLQIYDDTQNIPERYVIDKPTRDGIALKVRYEDTTPRPTTNVRNISDIIDSI